MPREVNITFNVGLGTDKKFYVTWRTDKKDPDPVIWPLPFYSEEKAVVFAQLQSRVVQKLMQKLDME